MLLQLTITPANDILCIGTKSQQNSTKQNGKTQHTSWLVLFISSLRDFKKADQDIVYLPKTQKMRRIHNCCNFVILRETKRRRSLLLLRTRRFLRAGVYSVVIVNYCLGLFSLSSHRSVTHKHFECSPNIPFGFVTPLIINPEKMSSFALKKQF